MTLAADPRDDRAMTLPFDLPHSPTAVLLGWELLDFDAAAGRVRIGFATRPDFLNPAGFVQGGIQTAMLDDCMGPAVWVMTSGTLYTATIDINVAFLNPARPGRLIGEGHVVQLGRTVAFVEARLMDEAGTMLARATASARLVPSGRIGV